MSKPTNPARRTVLLAALATAGLAMAPASVQAAGSKLPALLSESACDALNAWLGASSYYSGKIQGSMLSSGYLESTVDVQAWLQSALSKQGVDADLTKAVASTVATAWQSWVDDWSLRNTKAFPDFAAVAGSEAPQTESKGVSLSAKTSSGLSALSAKQLSSALTLAMGKTLASKNPGLANAFGGKLGARVKTWAEKATMSGILGAGPVPTFAPPYIPVGPVVGGKSVDGPVIITKI